MSCERVGVEGLGEAVAALRSWQVAGGATQLHPGDVGWFWRFGAEATAAALRAWRTGDRIVAVGLLDEPTSLRLALDPDLGADQELAASLLADLDDPARGVLPEGRVVVEAPAGSQVRETLMGRGWLPDQPWTPLVRDLGEPVEDPGLRVEVLDADTAGPLVARRVGVQRAAFERSTFTEERWQAMASGLPYADARCVVAYAPAVRGEGEVAVAAATVWSAGPGRPGLLEPLGVHREHRGRGYGRGISLAAAAALRALGCSTATVCTPSSNVAAVATYAAAGYRRLAEVPDLCRAA